MQHYLGVSLRDTVRDLCSDTPAGSPWWLLVQIDTLPPEGLFAASLAATQIATPDESVLDAASQRRGEYRGWGPTRRLLADLYDLQVYRTPMKNHGKYLYTRPGKRAGKLKGRLSPAGIVAALDEGTDPMRT